MGDKEIYKKGLETFGLETQLLKLAEECGELVAAINKHHIKQNTNLLKIDEYISKDGIYEEIADVKILIKQIEQDVYSKDAIAIAKGEKLEKFRALLERPYHHG